jgi:hypothetical protein
MSATSEANKKLVRDAFANMVSRTPFTIGAASFLERLCTLSFYIIKHCAIHASFLRYHYIEQNFSMYY